MAEHDAKNGHDHDHGHDHAHDHDHHHGHGGHFHYHFGGPVEEAEAAKDAHDPGMRSLSEALRVCFGLMKFVMILLVAAFFFSGAFNVNEGEVVLLLRFGKIQGAPGQQVMGPGGPHFAFPEPIDRIVRVSTKPKQVAIDRAFWFEVPPSELGKELDDMKVRSGGLAPGKDGALLTADNNLVHTRWSVTYKVEAQDAPLYAQYVGDEKAARALVESVAMQSITHTVAGVTSDEVLLGTLESARSKGELQRRIQVSLDAVKCGLTVTHVTLEQKTFPLATRKAFQEVSQAQSTKAEAIESARQKRNALLNGVAGTGHHQDLLAAIGAYEKARRAGDAKAIEAQDQRIAALIDESKGEVAKLIGEARNYRTEEQARVAAEKDLFEKLLEGYRRNPHLVKELLLQEARGRIFAGDVETFYVPPSGELYIEMNRDPELRRQKEAERLKLKRAGGLKEEARKQMGN